MLVGCGFRDPKAGRSATLPASDANSPPFSFPARPAFLQLQQTRLREQQYSTQFQHPSPSRSAMSNGSLDRGPPKLRVFIKRSRAGCTLHDHLTRSLCQQQDENDGCGLQMRADCGSHKTWRQRRCAGQDRQKLPEENYQGRRACLRGVAVQPNRTLVGR